MLKSSPFRVDRWIRDRSVRINLDQVDASAIAFPGQDGGEGARR